MHATPNVTITIRIDSNRFKITVPLSFTSADIIKYLIAEGKIPDANFSIVGITSDHARFIQFTTETLKDLGDISFVVFNVLRKKKTETVDPTPPTTAKGRSAPGRTYSSGKTTIFSGNRGRTIIKGDRGELIDLEHFERKDDTADNIEKQLRIAHQSFLVQQPMKVGVASEVSIMIARLIEKFKDRIESDIEKIMVSDKISVSLRGEDFEVTENFNNKSKYLPENDVAQWDWNVVPKKSGKRKLTIHLSTTVLHDKYSQVEWDYPYVIKEVQVEMNPIYTVKKVIEKNWQWFIGLVVGTGALWKVVEHFAKK